MTPDRCCYCGREIGPEVAAGHDGYGDPVCADCADGDEMPDARWTLLTGDAYALSCVAGPTSGVPTGGGWYPDPESEAA